MPFVPRPGMLTPQLIGILPPKLQTPLPDYFLRNNRRVRPSNSATSLSLRLKRWHSLTAWLVIAAGKRKPLYSEDVVVVGMRRVSRRARLPVPADPGTDNAG